MRKFKKKFRGGGKKEDKFRTNGQIKATDVRVVDDKGVMMGVMSVDRALILAKQRGLDLVEIAPKANPPTCKIIDYGKWKFKLSKKEKHSRKNQIKVVIKEIQLRPRTDVHDLEIKMKKAKDFLMNGCKVKVHLRYSGREMAHKDLGLKMLNKVVEQLKPVSVLEKDKPQMERRSAFLFFAPNPNWMKELQKKKKKSPASGSSSSSSSSGGGTKQGAGDSHGESGEGGGSAPPATGSASHSSSDAPANDSSSVGSMDSVAQEAVVSP